MRAFVVDHRHELRAIELFEVELWRSEKFEEKKIELRLIQFCGDDTTTFTKPN